MQKLVILPFCDFFKETKQMVVIGKKKKQLEKWVKREVENEISNLSQP